MGFCALWCLLDPQSLEVPGTQLVVKKDLQRKERREGSVNPTAMEAQRTQSTSVSQEETFGLVLEDPSAWK